MRGVLVRFGVLIAAAGTWAIGCGVATSDDLFSGNDGAGVNGFTGGGGGTPGASSSSSASSASGAAGGSASSSASSSSSGAGSSSGGVSSSTSSGGTSSSSTSGGFISNGVYCADKPCGFGEICCASFNDASQDHCAPAGSCGMGFATISCNEAADCPGKTCCGTWSDPQNFYVDISCQAVCQGPDSRIQCFNAPNVCPGGLTCLESVVGAGYMYCGN